MFKKGTKFYSIFKQKCPRCHEGNLFVQPGEKNYTIFGYTPDVCTNCGQAFILEPGFYYGAMYISYVISVALALPQFLLFYVGLDFSFRASLVAALIAQLILTPFIYKISRGAWINFFVRYDPQAISKKKSIIPTE